MWYIHTAHLKRGETMRKNLEPVREEAKQEASGLYQGNPGGSCGSCGNSLQLRSMEVPTFSGETEGYVCMNYGCPRNLICGFPFKRHKLGFLNLFIHRCSKCGLIPRYD